MNNRLKSVFFPTYVGLSKSVSRGKNNLLLDDLLQMIDDTMFINPFTDQHIFDYFKPSDNEDDELLNPNVIINDDDEMIPPVPKFGDALGLVLLFFMIGHLVIDICQKGLIWRLDKHSAIKTNWLI